MHDSDTFGAGQAISESSNDQNVASLENQINDANEEKSTKIAKDTKQRSFNQRLFLRKDKRLKWQFPRALKVLSCVFVH